MNEDFLINFSILIATIAAAYFGGMYIANHTKN